jgi:hypoxanthine-guanine phosphoribosyltransferase
MHAGLLIAHLHVDMKLDFMNLDSWQSVQTSKSRYGSIKVGRFSIQYWFSCVVG